MRIFFAQADINGSGYYRSQLPATALSKYGFEVSCGICEIEDPILYESDIVVMQRQSDKYWFEIMKKGRKRGCKYVFEIDDNILHLHKGIPDLQNNLNRAYGMLPLIKNSDAVITTTEPMVEMLRQLNKNTYIIPNFIIEPYNEIPIKRDLEPIKIGWSGSVSHCIDFEEYIINALKEIKNIYKNRIKLIFTGWIPSKLIGIASYFRFINPKEYLEFLRELRFDIGIIPCKDIPFNHSRSNLKYLEYSINKTVSIASSIIPYRDTISRDKGIVVKNKYNAWFNAIKKCIEDDDYRREIAINAYNFVKKNYMLQDHIKFIGNIFLNIARG